MDFYLTTVLVVLIILNAVTLIKSLILNRTLRLVEKSAIELNKHVEELIGRVSPTWEEFQEWCFNRDGGRGADSLFYFFTGRHGDVVSTLSDDYVPDDGKCTLNG